MSLPVGADGQRAPHVRVRGLSRRFGDAVAVDGIDFDVAHGELFGLVGPDGAGKTTTLRMLAGVLPPTGGDAGIDGVSVLAEPERIKHDIAYMAQRFGLYEDLTVRENIDFYADLYRVPRGDRAARRERLYAFSGLAPFEHRLAGALSGGMKQKLGLCCALIHRPRLLLLDEPTFGVDPISRRDLWLILHEMVADGITIIVSTAYLDEAERCDRVALLDHGRLLALDAPARLQAGLSGVLVALDTSDPRGARDLLRTNPRARSAVLFGTRVHLRTASAWPAEELAATLAAADIELVHAEAIEPSLEDVFIDFVEPKHTA